jgi:hypothetical protein
MSSTATWTRSRWFPLPHERISAGAEALTILLLAACLVSRRVESTAEAELSLRRSSLATLHCLAPVELLVEVLRGSSSR